MRRQSVAYIRAKNEDDESMLSTFLTFERVSNKKTAIMKSNAEI